jgi:hypothetical protein
VNVVSVSNSDIHRGKDTKNPGPQSPGLLFKEAELFLDSVLHSVGGVVNGLHGSVGSGVFHILGGTFHGVLQGFGGIAAGFLAIGFFAFLGALAIASFFGFLVVVALATYSGDHHGHNGCRHKYFFHSANN